ncbi:MAG TPA: DUF5698 domain-containing protein [Phycisphaerales bacterium]|nr:DUF5698 domain-containing protein [Phycisphaerales bacterium]
MPEMEWYIPVLIYFARIGDVSIGTVRTILVIGGHRYISAILGFFEVIIWVLAVGGVIAHLTNPWALLAYAGGFASGVMVGMFIEDRIALGYRVIRIISPNVQINVCERLRERGHFVTRLEGSGKTGPVEFAFMVVRRREVPKVRADVAEIDPQAFMSVGQADRPSAAALARDTTFLRRLWPWGTSLRK